MHICLFATSVFIPTGSSPSSLTGQLVRQPCCFPVRRRKPSCDRRDCEAGCWRFICSGGTAEVAGVKLLHLFAPKLLRNLLGFRFLRGSHEENNRSEGFKLKSQRRSRRLAAGCLSMCVIHDRGRCSCFIMTNTCTTLIRSHLGLDFKLQNDG